MSEFGISIPIAIPISITTAAERFMGKGEYAGGISHGRFLMGQIVIGVYQSCDIL